VDLNASCILLDEQLNVIEIVHPGRARNANGSVVHTDDPKSGGGGWDDGREIGSRSHGLAARDRPPWRPRKLGVVLGRPHHKGLVVVDGVRQLSPPTAVERQPPCSCTVIVCPPTPFLLAPIIVSGLETMLFPMVGLSNSLFNIMLLLSGNKPFFLSSLGLRRT